ncbi:MAG: hypothetical protein [Bacteriophage sp.]|nr:MAG: hypothetical protein [Bacteriophage sp.]
MRMVNKIYPIQLSAKDNAHTLQSMAADLTANMNCACGVETHTLDEFKHRVELGYTVILDDSRSTLIGFGYKDPDFNRVWWVKTSDTTADLYIDGYPTVVTHLGLDYDKATGTVSNPYINSALVAGIGLS